MQLLYKWILSVFFVMISIASHSAKPPLFLNIDPAWVLVQPGMTQNINFYDNVGNSYVNSRSLKQIGTVSLALGIRAYQDKNFDIHTGIRYLPVADNVVNGQIWQLKSPLFNDIAYSYQVRSSVLLIDNIISWTRYKFRPGFIFGIGGARNTTDGFQEVALADSATISLQNLSGKKNYQLSYELGFALDYAFDKFLVELAYRYINTGPGYFQAFPLSNTADKLSTGTLNYNVISLGMRAYYAL